MAAKVGNTLWVPRIPDTLRSSKIMLIGVDSDTDQSRGRVIGFCASINETYTKFFSATVVQPSSSSILEKMRELMVRSVKAFTDENGGAPPDEVIVLRDGCSFGELAAVREVEVGECL